MNVLFLGPRDSSVLAALRLDALRRADKVRMTSKPIASHDVWNGKFRGVDWLISHRYTHRVPDGVLSKFSDRNLNIHLGLCGQHRGVHPVFFSALFDYTYGYTIHRMTSQFDAGPVLSWGAKALYYPESHTFRSLWNEINYEATASFVRLWSADLLTNPESKPIGRYHSKAEFDELKWVLEPDGWDTLITVAKERYENRADRK